MWSDMHSEVIQLNENKLQVTHKKVALAAILFNFDGIFFWVVLRLLSGYRWVVYCCNYSYACSVDAMFI